MDAHNIYTLIRFVAATVAGAYVGYLAFVAISNVVLAVLAYALVAMGTEMVVTIGVELARKPLFAGASKAKSLFNNLRAKVQA